MTNKKLAMFTVTVTTEWTGDMGKPKKREKKHWIMSESLADAIIWTLSKLERDRFTTGKVTVSAEPTPTGKKE